MCVCAETGPQAGGLLADGGCPASTALRSGYGYQPDFYGTDSKEEASV